MSSLRQHGKNQQGSEELRFAVRKSQFVFSLSLFPSNVFKPDILSLSISAEAPSFSSNEMEPLLILILEERGLDNGHFVHRL